MTSGGGGKTTVGYYYYVGMHMVLTHGPVDACTGIKVDEKTAWSGEEDGGTINIDAPDLFGGESREGGIVGPVDIVMGETTETQNTYLTTQLGATVPAFRGVVSAVLNSVYIGLNPYMKKWQFRLQRIHKTSKGAVQWYDAKSAIASAECAPSDVGDLAIMIAFDTSASMDEIVSGTTTRLDNAKTAINDFLDYIDDNIVSNATVDINLRAWNQAGTAENRIRDIDSPDITTLKTWVSARSTSPDTDFTAAVATASAFFTGATSSSMSRLFLFITDGEPYPDGVFDLPSRIANASDAGDTLFSTPGVVSHGINIDLTDTSFTAYVDNTPEDGIPVVSGASTDALTNALISGLQGLYRYTSGYDMNPAHIIRECLLDTDWGLGYQSSDIDDTSFTAAADTLYTESMGISILWDKQIPIEDFIREILKHINAALYVSRYSGKFVLTLVRGGYAVGSLTTLDEDSIVSVSAAKRPALGELVNSVTVQYWDFCSGNDASLTVHDQALIQMQGNTVNTTIQYPGFSNHRTAEKAAMRDLRVLSTPLLSCSVIANRSASALNIGDVYVMGWSDLGINNRVMRITGVAYGDGRNNQIKLDVVEDVFSYPDIPVDDIDDEPTWSNPSQPPAYAEYKIAQEMPYYPLILAIGERETNIILDDSSDAGYVMAAAARPESAINSLMYTDAGNGYEEVAMLDYCGTCLLTAAVDETDTTITYDNDTDMDFVEVDTWGQIDDEIVAITAINTTTKQIILGRGVLDTAPRKHVDNSRLYCWHNYNGLDKTEYADSEEIDIKLLTITGQGTLPITQAGVDTVTLDTRAYRPYPPGKLRIDGDAYPSETVIVESIPVTWTHRDRLQQTSATLYDETYENIGPESGTTYNLYVIDSSDVTQISHTGITGTSQTVDMSAEANDDYTLQVWSLRDAVTSFQCAEWSFTYQYISYHLDAQWNASNQSFTDTQVLDTSAEGVDVGSLTANSTYWSIDTNALKCSAGGTVTTNTVVGESITRSRGLALLGKAKSSIISSSAYVIGWATSTSSDWAVGRDTSIQTSSGNSSQIVVVANNTTQQSIDDGTAKTTYKEYALILGGYSSGEPWDGSDTGYDDGVVVLCKIDGASNWLLYGRWSPGDDTTLYPFVAAYNISTAYQLFDYLQIVDEDYSSLITPIVLDTFTDTDTTTLASHTPDVDTEAGGWTDVSSKYTISSNAAITDGTQSSYLDAYIDAGEADVMVEVDGYWSETIKTWSYILARYTDANNLWLAGQTSFGTTPWTWGIYEKNAGSYTTRASDTGSTTGSGGVTVRQVLITDDEDMFFYIPDEGISVSYASAALNKTSTNYGISGTQSGSGTTPTFDNFAIYPRGTNGEYNDIGTKL